jgi:hypothetical protein
MGSPGHTCDLEFCIRLPMFALHSFSLALHGIEPTFASFLFKKRMKKWKRIPYGWTGVCISVGNHLASELVVPTCSRQSLRECPRQRLQEGTEMEENRLTRGQWRSVSIPALVIAGMN